MKKRDQPFILILGIAQDGGVPHTGCQKKCCRKAWEMLSARLYATSIAIVDPAAKQRWLIDITPDIKDQLHVLNRTSPVVDGLGISGIFLTHGHIGHYTGLSQFEKAVMNTQNVPIYVMPRFRKMLRTNEPWQTLIREKNIILKGLQVDKKVTLSSQIQVQPFMVPHRGEYTETVGFYIFGPNKRVLFIPDIDSWNDWGSNIESEIKRVDLAFIDGTFFDKSTLPHRDMSEIPHPAITETMKRFAELGLKEKKKIHFIHLNHTNPVLVSHSRERKRIERDGFCVARQLEKNFI